jgi:hypothetical protein
MSLALEGGDGKKSHRWQADLWQGPPSGGSWRFLEDPSGQVLKSTTSTEARADLHLEAVPSPTGLRLTGLRGSACQ